MGACGFICLFLLELTRYVTSGRVLDLLSSAHLSAFSAYLSLATRSLNLSVFVFGSSFVSSFVFLDAIHWNCSFACGFST